MNRKLKQQSLGKKTALLLAILLPIIGYCIGSHLGKHMIVHFLSGENSLLFLLYQPAFENISKIRLLGSNNEYKRLVGYHSLIENRRIDVDFLIDRYTSEESIYLRRSIIWLMGYSKDEKSIYNFLSDIYEEAPWRNKLEVLRTMKRLDINLFNKFIKYHNIDIGQFNGI